MQPLPIPSHICAHIANLIRTFSLFALVRSHVQAGDAKFDHGLSQHQTILSLTVLALRVADTSRDNDPRTSHHRARNKHAACEIELFLILKNNKRSGFLEGRFLSLFIKAGQYAMACAQYAHNTPTVRAQYAYSMRIL